MMSGDRTIVPRPRTDASEAPKRAPDIAADFKKLSARIRGELYMLQRSLASRNYVQAETEVRQDPDDAWTKERFADAMAPYYEMYKDIDLTPRARTVDRTFIRETGKRQWEVTQRIVDPSGEEDWALFGTVDLTETIPEDAPLVQLRRIGT